MLFLGNCFVTICNRICDMGMALCGATSLTCGGAMTEKQPDFEILRRVLRPVSPERAVEILHERVGSDEQLTLADAGLENEVREILDGKSVASCNTTSAHSEDHSR
jgi:hypothetical protein